MRTALQDLQYGLRTFCRNPGFSLTLVLVLSLGISGTTTIFTVFYGVILQPLPLRDPDRLVMLGAPAPPDGDWLGWWSQSRTLASLCEYRAGGVNLTESDWPTRVSAAMVSASFFSVFEVSPQLGRPFLADDETPGQNRVAILSDRLWKQNFGRDPHIIERDIALDGIRHTIIGIMPPGFEYPGRTDVWVPRVVGGGSLYLGDDEQANWPLSLRHTLVGRLRPDVNLTQARSELQTLFRQLEETYAHSQVKFGSGVQVIPLQEVLVGNFRPALLALLAGAGFLLLTACANSANLMLAQAAIRQKELAIRICVGATPWRVMRQLLTEAVLLAVGSGSLSMLVAHWGVQIVRVFGPRDVPRLAEVHIDPVVLGFALGLSLLVGISVAIAPALQAFTPNLTESLKEGGARATTGLRLRFRQILVIVQVALTLILVMGASLTVQSFFRLTQGALGFDPTGVLTMSLALPKAKYSEPTQDAEIQPAQGGARKSPISATHGIGTNQAAKASYSTRAHLADFHRRLLDGIEHLPGVVAVGAVNQLPLGSTSGRKMWIDVPGTQGGLVLLSYITGDYFRAMGIPMLRGRSFTENDSESAPKVAIIDETLARLFWDDKEPLGQSLVVAGESEAREIVAVVDDLKHTELTKEPEPHLYLPYLQPLSGRSPPLEMVVAVRTNSDPEMMVPSLRHQMTLVDKDVPPFRVRTMEEVVSEAILPYRFRGILMASFALLASILAVIGIYGVMAYSVTSRIREIGTRMSLGATSGQIRLMILREGARLALVGVSIGIAGSFGLNQLIASLLYGVRPTDPATLLGSALVIVTGALLACLVPARAASRVEPAIALRYE